MTPDKSKVLVLKPCNGQSADYVISDCCDYHYRLQASATELLEACKDALTELQANSSCLYDNTLTESVINGLKETIAKAEGR